MNHDFLKDLNNDQKKAVMYTDGPIIILAGAGSGKTRVLTHKVMYLILEKKIHPLNILMVTFTNKAANEMKERILSFLTNDQRPASPAGRRKTNDHPVVSTFHSLCAKILRIEGKNINLSSQFAIYDTSDQVDAVKSSMKKLNISAKDYKPSSILASISEAKNELITHDEYPRYARGHFQEVVARVYKEYQKILKENHALDFDDLLLKTIFLFDNSPQVLDKYQNRFRYILIDEYQDTNKAQYVLTRYLAKKWNNICVVGDFSQSIYSWRGADFTNLTRFKEDFLNVKTFSLSQNYRSTQKILDAASTVISHNTTHPVLRLWTENDKGEDISIFEAMNEQNEIEFIVNYILTLKSQNPDFSLSDIAVLYRTNAQSRVLEEIFLHNSIPYVLIGGTRFYERKEVKDALAFLRCLDNENDKVSLQRIEKIGKKRLQKFLEFQKTVNVILGRSSEPQNDDSRISNPLTDSGRAHSSLARMTTIELLDAVLKKTDYLDLYDEHDEDDRARLENIKELRSVALNFPNLTNFLENVSLVEQEHMPDPSRNLPAGRQGSGQVHKGKTNEEKVTFMTMHAAKGLEFPSIFMIGMEEGLFPHSRSVMDKNALEEERRLCYVGMTRARKKLFLSYARKRLFFGQRNSNIVSRFVLELPENVIQQNLHSINIPNDNVPEFL
jgi:DNA helicase II / ATP-dependent DNA helicase PcrA